MNSQQSTAEAFPVPEGPFFTHQFDGSRATLSYTNSVPPSRDLCSTPALPVACEQPSLAKSASGGKFTQHDNQSSLLTDSSATSTTFQELKTHWRVSNASPFRLIMLKCLQDIQSPGSTMRKMNRIGKPLSIILLPCWLSVSWISLFRMS